jgi:DNA-binding transcriptional regulator YhcF (GntR family)
MLLRLDFSADVPIYLQIRNQIVVAIAEGKLTAGEQLPTIRALATEAGINMMTVSKVYQILKKEGYIATDRRSGAVVTGEVKRALSENALE